MSQFDKLLADLGSAQAETDVLAKSLQAGGDAGSGAGGGEGGEGGKGEGAGAGEGGEGAGGEGGGEGGEGGEGGQTTIVKSFKVTLPDGREVDAEDGTEMVKALMSRLDTNDDVLSKAFGQTLAIIGAQGKMIKALGEQVKALSGQGRGRKTMIAIHEKNGAATDVLAKGGQGGGSGDDGITADQFMLKANHAFDQKKLSGVELTTIDVCLRSGETVPAPLISKVLSAAAAAA